MPRRSPSCIAAGLVAILSSIAWAESPFIEPNLRFTHLSIRDGLVGGEVRAILQDQEGAVWIASEEGLCRFDGYEVRNFRHAPLEEDSLSSNSVTALLEDRDGSIWVGTESGFLDRLNPQNGRFEHCPIAIPGEDLSRLDGIRCLMLDRTRRLWIGTGDGVVSLDPSRTQWKRMGEAPGLRESCSALIESDDGAIWMASESGRIARWVAEDESFLPVADVGVEVRGLARDPSGRILVVALGKGVLALDPAAGSGDLTLVDRRHDAMAVAAGLLGDLWVGSSEGLSRIGESGGRSEFRRDSQDPGSLLAGGVSTLFVDRRGVLWVGFSSGGVSRFLLEKSWFSKFVHGGMGRPGLSGRSVSAVLKDGKGRLWMGTSAGLDCWDPARPGMANAVLSRPVDGGTEIFEVTALYEDGRGRIWAGSREGNLFRPAPEPGGDGSPPLPSGRLPRLRGMVTALLEDGDGRLWVGSRGGGITVLGAEGEPVAEFSPGGPEALPDRFINDLCRDRDGTIWVATSSEGLLRYDPGERRFKAHPRMREGEILDLFLDSEGVLWAGSAGRGLTRLNLDSDEILTINRRNSSGANPLPDDTIRALAEDGAGFLWLSTDEGVARMDRKSFEFRSFGEQDGLQANLFHARVAARDASGRILFGGPNGINVIDPGRLPEPERAERPVLTGLELFGDPVFPSPEGYLKRPLALTDLLTIPYARDGRIAFRFSTLDYTTPKRNLFRYRLEGIDEDWQRADDTRRASYAGLPPGTYRFVVASSTDGLQWSADHASVRLEIRPQWYARWYTRVGFGVLAAILLGYLMLYRARRREEILRRRQEQLEIKYSKAEAALARQLQHAMLLEQTGLALGADDGSAALLENALRQLGESFGVARSFVRTGTLDAAGQPEGDFPLVAEHIDPAWEERGSDLDRGLIDGDRFVGRVLRSDRAVAVSDAAGRRDLFPESGEGRGGGTQSILAVRTSYLGQPNGYVALQHLGSPRDWQADEIKLIESLAGQFGLVLAQIAQQERDERHKRELEKAKQEADLANRSKSDFLAKMTHELRTPLNAIIGFSELLSDDTDLTRRQRETLDIINHSGEHLLGVINDILEISKIEAGKVEIRSERFNLSGLLTSVYEMLAFGARSKGLAFAIDKVGQLPGDIVADKGKLRQVLVNLVGNATKFTEEGGITVTVRATPLLPGTRQRLVGFEIRDTGPGIAAEELPKLFEKFTQTQTGQKARRGTGLGLAISKAFVEMMGGRVEVASTVGVGTIFRFTILCEDAELGESEAGSMAAPSPSPAPGGGGGRRLVDGHPEIRILIVEDQPANRLLASRILKSAGFLIGEAENGAEGVEKCREFRPHLILMDEEMPVMRGREATRIIREEAEGRGPVIVALTAFALDETRLAALASGSDDFLAKPFRIDELLGMIARHLPVEYQRSSDAAA